MKLYLLLLSTLFCFSSCSKLSVGVYWADTFVISELDDYYTLSSTQKDAARQAFNLAFTEVRRQEFPPFAEALDGMAAEAEKGGMKLDRIEHWHEKLQGILKAAGRRFEPLGQMLVAQQAPLGFKRFDEKFRSKQEEVAKKLKPSDGTVKQAKKRTQRLIDETFESLTPEQEALVDELLKESPLMLEHESRLASFERFKVVRAEEKSRVAYVRQFFFDWDSVQTPAFLKARDAYRKKSLALMHRLLETASPKQLKTLVENLRGRASEFRKLSVVK